MLKTLCEEYPGIQSILIPADGIAQECIISFDQARIWILVSVGRLIDLVGCNLIILLTDFFI